MKPEGFHWSEATEGDIVVLYEHANKIRKRQHWTWKEFFAETLDGFAIANRAEDNFRKGKLGKKLAAKIFGWLEANHSSAAANISAALTKTRKPRRSRPKAKQAPEVVADAAEASPPTISPPVEPPKKEPAARVQPHSMSMGITYTGPLPAPVGFKTKSHAKTWPDVLETMASLNKALKTDAKKFLTLRAASRSQRDQGTRHLEHQTSSQKGFAVLAARRRAVIRALNGV